MAIPKALNIALDFEKKGLMFYLKMAEKTEHPLGKRLFYSLSKEEIDHIIRFEDIHTSLRKGKKWPRLTLKGISNIEKDIKNFFNAVIGRKTKNIKADNIEGYKTAMKTEKKSYDMYDRLSKKTGNENERQFFNALKKEEAKHSEAIENVLSYLTNSGDWLQFEESKTWNWMNT